MNIIVEQIIEELERPFRDPREYRNPQKQSIKSEDLFYMLIDETERTFKKGIIVTATVVKIIESEKNAFVLGKLDNGLDAIIDKEGLIGGGAQDRLSDAIQPGHVISGRIFDIQNKDESKFKVVLVCKREDLESHKKFVDLNVDFTYNEEDFKNQNLHIEKRN